MASRYTPVNDLMVLNSDEVGALHHFNSVVFYAGASRPESINHARIRAIRIMPPKVLGHLVSAFQSLWPHWFTNGRQEMSPQEACLSVVSKLTLDQGPSIVSGLEWLGRMGGMKLTSGKYRTAVFVNQDRPGGRGVRGVKMCVLHTDKRSVGHGMCCTCYQRNRRLILSGYDTEAFPEELWNKLLLHDKFKHGAFARSVDAIIKPYEAKHNESYRMAPVG